ncbi:MAG: class D sortase [Clostridia bacterium]|nr:class D sortase [Clostridia bacterium]
MRSSITENNNPVFWKAIEAIIIDIIVASIGIIGIILTIRLLFGNQINKAIDYVNTVSLKTNSAIVKDIKFDNETETITSYPEYGTRYGNIRIESLGISLPLYYGDKPNYLRYGIGQSSGSYFPGEGGSIVCLGHNNKAFLYDLPKIKDGATIEINTTYGDFTYKVYQTKIINMYDVDALEIQKEKEILMLYTCYPVETLGDKKDRFVVYAERVYE